MQPKVTEGLPDRWQAFERLTKSSQSLIGSLEIDAQCTD